QVGLCAATDDAGASTGLGDKIRVNRGLNECCPVLHHCQCHSANAPAHSTRTTPSDTCIARHFVSAQRLMHICKWPCVVCSLIKPTISCYLHLWSVWANVQSKPLIEGYRVPWLSVVLRVKEDAAYVYF